MAGKRQEQQETEEGNENVDNLENNVPVVIESASKKRSVSILATDRS